MLAELRFKLITSRRDKLRHEESVIKLRQKETFITEEISFIKSENEFLMHLVKELNTEISQMQTQLTMINVCKKSEEAKISVYYSNLDQFKNEYDELFQKEQRLLDLQNQQLKKKIAEAEEEEKKKMMEIIEKNKQIHEEAALIEQECEAIEQECCILTKRNKAIMLKLRKKLIETEDIRRELMKNSGSYVKNEMQ